jgi:hypothetical protein
MDLKKILNREAVKGKQGVTLVILALMMLVLLAFVSLAVDVGYLMATRNELQNVADAAALAGAGDLGKQLSEIDDNDIVDEAQIKATAQQVAFKNKAAMQNFNLNENDIEIGKWDTKTHRFSPGDLRFANAVRVTARIDRLDMFFGKALALDNFEAVATAALTGLGKKVDVIAPVAISSYWFDRLDNASSDILTEQEIKFYPTGSIDGCAGWHTFQESPANANRLRNILDSLTDETYDSPEIMANETYLEFIGGNVASALPNLKVLYEKRRDPVTLEWETVIPVYSDDNCSNPTGSKLIVGFATVIITDVLAPPDGQLIQAKVILLPQVEPERGQSGNDYSTFGIIPSLVK